MPCITYYDDHPEDIEGRSRSDLEKHVAFLESALCASLNALETVSKSAAETLYGEQHWQRLDFYNSIDYQAAGIKKSLLVGWHKLHKKQDAKYRAEEAARQAEAEAKRAALAKLTPAERKLLGVTDV